MSGRINGSPIKAIAKEEAARQDISDKRWTKCDREVVKQEQAFYFSEITDMNTFTSNISCQGVIAMDSGLPNMLILIQHEGG